MTPSKQILDIHRIIHDAKARLEMEGIKPKWIKLSPNAHETLVRELSKIDGRKHTRVFEIMGMRVDIEEECPNGGAYMGGDDDESFR